MTAHVGGVPFEELAPLLLSSGGAALLLARTWLISHLGRRRRA